jgi:hypothetical protein
MAQWVRLWEDMPTDPKWRLVARRAVVSDALHRVTVRDVVAVFVQMLICAGIAKNRGSLEGWNDEVVAVALDAETELVTAIREAMNGLVLDGDRLKSWEKRQPNREDSSTERVRALREKRNAVKRNYSNVKRTETHVKRGETQCNAPEEKRIDPDKKKKPNPSGLSKKKIKTEIADGSQPDAADLAFAADAGMDSRQVLDEWAKFRDHHLKNGSTFADWKAAWRGWVRNSKTARPNGHDAAKTVARAALIFVQQDTPQWNAWEAIYLKSRGIGPPKTQQSGTLATGWYFPTEWPPDNV